ncbi:MAG: hypothetical protein NW205_13060 [Hyphomicrobiaceae bacterium]|nr:hypothetical protein [Hyphomicrobiaceae bacterium]
MPTDTIPHETLATIGLVCGLALTAIGLVAVARRYSASGFAVALIGLLGIAFAGTWSVRELAQLRAAVVTSPAPPAAPTVPEPNQAVQEALTRARDAESLAATATSERDEARRKAEDAEAALTTERTARDAAREAARQEAAADAQSRAEASAKAALARAEEEIAGLRRRIAELERPPAASDPTVPVTEVVAYMRSLIGKRLDTPFYEIAPLPGAELVEGLTGSWYVLRLKVDGVPLTFPDARFRLDGDPARMGPGIEQAQRDVLDPVALLAKDHRVFVRGSADARRVIGSDADQPSAQQLAVLTPLGDGRYGRSTAQRPIMTPLRNDDLPALRADWLRGRLTAAGMSEPIDILATTPSANPGGGVQRTAEIVLYVDW